MVFGNKAIEFSGIVKGSNFFSESRLYSERICICMRLCAVCSLFLLHFCIRSVKIRVFSCQRKAKRKIRSKPIDYSYLQIWTKKNECTSQAHEKNGNGKRSDGGNNDIGGGGGDDDSNKLISQKRKENPQKKCALAIFTFHANHHHHHLHGCRQLQTKIEPAKKTWNSVAFLRLRHLWVCAIHSHRKYIFFHWIFSFCHIRFRFWLKFHTLHVCVHSVAVLWYRLSCNAMIL